MLNEKITLEEHLQSVDIKLAKYIALLHRAKYGQVLTKHIPKATRFYQKNTIRIVFNKEKLKTQLINCFPNKPLPSS